MAKRFLFILTHTPYGGNGAREGLDMLLTTAAFDQAVSVLFLDDGVFQLLPAQRTEASGHKPISATIAAFSLYDIDDCWVEYESLQERGLTAAQLMAPVRLIARGDVAALLDEQDVVVTC